MNKGIKIFIIVMATMGFLSLIFLLTSKKRPVKAVNNTSKTIVSKIPASKTSGPKTVSTSSAKKAKSKVDVSQQWQQCKNKTLDQSRILFWNIQITEAIPQGGTYAKGYLNGDQNFLVDVIIKADSQIKEKINKLLVVGNKAMIRGNCVNVAADGAVVLQAF